MKKMKKLKLDLDALKVEEFSTSDGGAEKRGTVRGHYYSYPNWNCPVTWNNYGCHSVSGQVACICLPNNSDFEETCVDCP